jgi:hypothetical protein
MAALMADAEKKKVKRDKTTGQRIKVYAIPVRFTATGYILVEAINEITAENGAYNGFGPDRVRPKPNKFEIAVFNCEHRPERLQDGDPRLEEPLNWEHPDVAS